jgi:hypothetical protein
MGVAGVVEECVAAGVVVGMREPCLVFRVLMLVSWPRYTVAAAVSGDTITNVRACVFVKEGQKCITWVYKDVTRVSQGCYKSVCICMYVCMRVCVLCVCVCVYVCTFVCVCTRIL